VLVLFLDVFQQIWPVTIEDRAGARARAQAGEEQEHEHEHEHETQGIWETLTSG
jgi:hypothetical protein